MSEIIFAEWFKLKLQEMGVSAGEFAQLSPRISRAAAYFYLDGSRVPNSAALDNIAKKLNIDRATMPSFAPRRSK